MTLTKEQCKTFNRRLIERLSEIAGTSLASKYSEAIKQKYKTLSLEEQKEELLRIEKEIEKNKNILKKPRLKL